MLEEVLSDTDRSNVRPQKQLTLAERLALYEAELIQEALRACGGNQRQAARLLGILPSTLHYKRKRLALRIAPTT